MAGGSGMPWPTSTYILYFMAGRNRDPGDRGATGDESSVVSQARCLALYALESLR